MMGRKGVSSADVQSDISKPFFPPTNEGDQMKMPKLINISHIGLRRSERIRKSQNSKEVEESHPKYRNAFTFKILLALYTVLSIFLLNTYQELWIPSLMP